MFCCPFCGSQQVESDCPKAWRVITYNDNGEVIDCDTDQGSEIANERCATCSKPFVEEEWMTGQKNEQTDCIE